MYSVKELERFMEQRRWPSGRDFGGHARHGVGSRSLFCRHHDGELEIPLYPPYRFFNRDYSVFDCGGMAFSEAHLTPFVRACSSLPGKPHPYTAFLAVPVSLWADGRRLGTNPAGRWYDLGLEAPAVFTKFTQPETPQLELAEKPTLRAVRGFAAEIGSCPRSVLLSLHCRLCPLAST